MEIILNILYLLVMVSLPFLWFGDYKKTMSLFFKSFPPAANGAASQSNDSFEFTPPMQVICLIVGMVAYYLHRRWRLQSMARRCEYLTKELSLLDTRQVEERKQNYLRHINALIAKRTTIKESHQCVGPHQCPWDKIEVIDDDEEDQVVAKGYAKNCNKKCNN